jgi:DNA-directed RNA polymerase specialized sigma24 family protein
VLPNRGDASKIEALYLLHGSALLLFATAIIGERARAQDLVHQVFLKLMEGGNLQRAADTKAFPFVCIRNAALNKRF